MSPSGRDLPPSSDDERRLASRRSASDDRSVNRGEPFALAALLACAPACGKIAPEAPPVDAPVHAVTYAGVIATVPPVGFGGDPYCHYTMTLTNVAITLQLDDAGGETHVISGTAMAHEIEAVVPPCPYGATPARDASFTFVSQMAASASEFLVFDGAPGDSPVVDLGVTLQTGDGGYLATFEFHRADLGPPLDWDVFAMAQLTAQP